MAITAIVEVATNEFVETGHIEDASFVKVTLPRNPIPRVERFNGNFGNPGFTSKSAPETASFDAGVVATRVTLAQQRIDSWPIEYRALVLALIDQLNTIRAALPSPLGPITPAQALAAVRTKAGTLS